MESGQGTEPYAFVEEELCDFPVLIEGAFTYNYRVREGRGVHEQAFFVQNSYSFTETLSANDQYVTVTANKTFNEVRAVPLGNGVFQFTAIDVGIVTFRDADGRVLAREAGAIRGTYIFDTLNDNEPGGVFLNDLGTAYHGRFDDLDAVCAALAPSGQ